MTFLAQKTLCLLMWVTNIKLKKNYPLNWQSRQAWWLATVVLHLGLGARESRVQCYPRVHDNCFWEESNNNEWREKGRQGRGREEEMGEGGMKRKQESNWEKERKTRE